MGKVFSHIERGEDAEYVEVVLVQNPQAYIPPRRKFRPIRVGAFFFFNNVLYSGKVLVQLLVLITCQIRKGSSYKCL